MLNLTRNFYRFSAATLICLGLSYLFYRANPIQVDGHGFPLSVLTRYHDASLNEDRMIPGIHRTHEEKMVLSDPNVHSVSVECVNFEISILRNSKNEINYLFQGEGGIQQEVQNGILKIRSKDSPQPRSGSLTIQVPEGVDFLEIRTISGNLKIDLPTLKRASIHSVSGNMILHARSIGEIEWNTTSGDAKFVGAPSALKAHTISGDIDVSVPQGFRVALQFQTVSGSKILSDQIADPSGSAYQVNTVSGNLKIGVQ